MRSGSWALAMAVLRSTPSQPSSIAADTSLAAPTPGGHVLEMPGGHRYGVDHGVTFHHEPKLRTVLWGWHGEPLTDEEVAGVHRVCAALSGTLGDALAGALTDLEIDALERRCRRLLDRGVLPTPRGDWPAIPWPPV